MATVMVFGTFDGLHHGHINMFEQALQHGSRLVVVVARDATVRHIKKHEPRFTENERLAQVQACDQVYKAVLGSEVDKMKVVIDENPDCICLGYDQDHQYVDALMKQFGDTIKIVRLQPYHADQYKSSLLNNAV